MLPKMNSFVAIFESQDLAEKPDVQVPVDSTDGDLAKKVELFLSAKRNGLRQISVWAGAGNVRLSGVVGSFFLRQLALEMTKRVAGVRHVVDDLEVELEPLDAR